jgi:Cupin-like domain
MTRGRFEPKLKHTLRSARARQRAYELGPEWQAWVLENLSRGAAPEELLSALTGQGVPRVTASRAIAEIRDSAVLRLSRAAQERSRQLTSRARVLTELRRHAAEVERVPMLSEREFFERYYATNTPVVLTQAMHDWPALRRWTPEYFRDHYGKVEIEIVEGRDGDPYCDRKHDTVKRTTTMAAYAERVMTAGRTNDFYFTARNRNIELEGLRSLNDDVRAPPEFFLPEPHKGSQSFWFGPEGSLTATHHDPTNILFCQIYGSKRVQLAPPTDVGVLMQAEGYYNKALHDLKSYEGLRGSHILDLVLSPGEALFIPALWWHRVEALSISISFSLLHFKRTNRYPDYRP